MDKKMGVVRKLLAKAERAGTPEEADAFRSKATELMIRYSIDEALLGAQHETGDTVGSRRFVITGYAKPKTSLLSWVGDVFGCQTVKLNGSSTYGTAVCVVYGWESDLALLEVLYASLVVQAEREAAIARRAAPWGNGQAFKTSFLIGFASVVANRLEQQHRRAVAEHVASDVPGTALVLVDRSAAVAARLREENPSVRASPASATSSSTGFYSGRDVGARADLGRGGLGGQRRAIR